MLDEDGFDWGNDFDNNKYERETEEKYHEIAYAFIRHLKNLILKNSSHSNSIQITQKDLFKDFKHDVYEIKLGYGKQYIENSFGAYYAEQLNLIKIDETVRPYKYTLIEENQDNIELRPYQRFIIEDTTNAEGSVLIEAPTGSGKSVMANEIAKEEITKGGKVLVVAPKIILLEQLQETFIELSPQIIHGVKDYNKSHNVFISTIQTAHKRDLGFEPTMVLIDEVHFGFSGKMIKQLLEDFKGKLVGLSATPYDEDGIPLQGFDLHINRYNIKYMLSNGFLVMPKCFAPVKVDLSKISAIAGDYNQTDLDREFNNLEEIMQVVKNTKDVILERKASLIFCINIAHSEAMADAYNSMNIPTKAIHSKLSKEDRYKILEDFKSGKLKALTNPVMLTTGFDHPITDTIVLARATKSQNLYRQMVGRALRLSENKKDAVVLDCSNVISNLGLPIEDIKEKKSSFTRSKKVCSNCESDKLYKRIEDNKAYLYCSMCGNRENIMEEGYECEFCGLVHTSNSKFINRNNGLYLVCNDCECETLVSKNSSKEEMSEIFDLSLIKELQKTTLFTYQDYLINKFSSEFLFKEETINQLKAINSFISHEPYLFIGIQDRILNWETIKKDDNNNYIWNKDYNKTTWRLLDEYLELEYINGDLKVYIDQLNMSNSLSKTIELLQEIRKAQNEKPLGDIFIYELNNAVKKSKKKSMKSICNKRLKNLYFEKKDLNSMLEFVAMIESVLEE